jgi:cardiolipin synthase
MSFWTWFSVHHVVGLVTFGLTIVFAAKVLRRRRPAGTSAAWLLGIVLVPYVAIPLFLALGDRKLRTASLKTRLQWSAGPARVERPAEVVWLDRPDAALASLLGEIHRAGRTIHLSTFLIGDDEVGRRVIAALTERAKHGVEVCVLYDGLFAPRAPRRALRELRAAGGRVAVFLPLLHLPWRGRTNVRNHRKLAVFDGVRAIVGGMNLSDDYLGSAPRADRWRDLSIAVEGEPAAALAQLFHADWLFAHGGALSGIDLSVPDPIDIDVIPTGPDCAEDTWHDTVLQLVFDARRRISIATPYFAPDESLLQALAIAARRGVEVTIVVPARSNHWLSDRVAGQMLRDLERAGVRVARFRPAMMHAKCLLVDDAIAAVGSANFNARSLFLDFEVTVVLRGELHNRRMAQWFAETLRDCDAGAPAAHGVMLPVEALARLLAPIA